MKNPIRDKKGFNCVRRGGDWVNYPNGVQASARHFDVPNRRYYFIGFRIVRNKQ